MSSWQILPDTAAAAARCFADLDAVFALEGEVVASDPMSKVIRVRVGDHDYYIKRYAGLGSKPLRRRFVTPRVKSEWQNLQRFAAWGIPTAPLIAYGLEQRWGRFVRGALITAGIANAADLRQLALSGDPRLKSRRWLDGVSHQLAGITRSMHNHGFVHNDLKWRNLLVDDADVPTLYLIDCPSGGFWWNPFLQYRIVKDLACLDKLAKYHLTRTRRLRFYLDYAQKRRLDDTDKQRIRKIIGFFKGRE